MSASWFSVSKATLIDILTKLTSVFDTKADASHSHTKSDITDFAHDHPLIIEAASTATSAINLDPNAIYKLTAGGKTFIFKTPADSDHYAWADITGKPSSYPPSAHTHTVSQITDFPSTMPPSSHTHGNIQNGGTLQTTDVAIANGDKLVVTDSSDSSKIARASIAFDGSTATKCLTQKGTWESFTNNAGTITGIKMNGASKGTSGVVDLGTVITSHQDISGKADKTATVSTVAWDSTNKKLTKTINGTTTDVVTGAMILGGLTVKVGSTSYTPSSGVVSLPAYPTTLPASDVYAWAKASSKPSYAWSEITGKPSSFTPASHTHGNIQNGGTLQTNDIAIASGDKLVVTDSSDSSKIARASISFDGSTATKYLSQKGTWESLTKSMVTSALGYTPPTSDTNNAVTQTNSDKLANDYEVLFSATATNATLTEGARKSKRLTFNPGDTILKGYDELDRLAWYVGSAANTSTGAGTTELVLGSSAKGHYGILRLYSTNGTYLSLRASATNTAYTLDLPAAAGTIALTSDIHNVVKKVINIGQKTLSGQAAFAFSTDTGLTDAQAANIISWQVMPTRYHAWFAITISANSGKTVNWGVYNLYNDALTDVFYLIIAYYE